MEFCEKMSSVNHQKKGVKKNEPWFDMQCQNLRKNIFSLKSRIKKARNDYLKESLKQELDSLRKEYKKIVKFKKSQFCNDMHENLRKLRSSNPKEYWKLLKKGAHNDARPNPVDIDSFKSFFENLNRSKQSMSHNSNSDDAHHVPQALNDELNIEFSEDEVKTHMLKLKNNKASGCNGILNEFLKNSSKSMLALITKIFNLIFESGSVPSDWSIGIIRPIYKKKGQQTDPNNYRPITLLSCLGKLFTSILNERLTNYYDVNYLLGEEQAGFREGYSTVDHTFVLHSLIDLYLSDRRRIYCVFVDYRKAFDSVNRFLLWEKLLRHNVNGKFLKIVQNIYKNAKSFVMNGKDKSDVFNCEVGVRQGDNLSPLLFATFLNDFNLFIAGKSNGIDLLPTGIANKLESVRVFFKLFTLLYADDTVVLATNEKELQNSLNVIHEYCDLNDLNVNVDKTKIVIFSRGKVRRMPTFTFGNTEVEVVSKYTYLGTVFNYNGRFIEAQDKQITQARKALYSLILQSSRLSLPIDLELDLFDKLVIPILLYGSELWGLESNLKKIELFCTRFYKKLLKVGKSTAVCMAYGEVGRYSINRLIESRMINFWARLECGISKKLSRVIYALLKDLYDKEIYISPWLKKIKSILDKTGLSYLWNDCAKFSINWIKNTINQRLTLIYSQNWHYEVNSNSLCINYRIFKVTCELEAYLTKIPVKFRTMMIKFRCGNHKLPIVAGRYNNIDRSDRLCPRCDLQKIGDEYHYLFECPIFEVERKRHLTKQYRKRPNIEKMNELFNSTNYSTMLNLAKFCSLIVRSFS